MRRLLFEADSKVSETVYTSKNELLYFLKMLGESPLSSLENKKIFNK